MQAQIDAPKDPDTERSTAMPVLLMLARRGSLLIGLPLIAALLTAVICKLSTPVFTATAQILPPQYNEATVSSMSSQLGGESQIGNSALTLKNPTDLFVGILGSRTIADAVIIANKLAEHYDATDSDVLRRQLAKATDIHAAKDGIISISVDDRDSQFAAKLANAYVDEFYVLAQALARRESARRAEFYRRALVHAEAQLHIADLALTAVEKSTGLTRLSGQDSTIIQAAAELQAQISTREVQLRTMAAYATQTNPDVQLIQRELANLRGELDRLRTHSPVASIAGQGSATPAPGPDGSDGRMPMVELGGVPDAYLIHVQKKRDVLYWETIVNLLGRYAELGQIDERRDMSLFQVLDTAVAPSVKSKPRTTVNMVLAAIGTGIVTLIAVLADAYIRERCAANSRFSTDWRELRHLLAVRTLWADAAAIGRRLRLRLARKK